MISADMVKELRDKTGAGMMDCKRALTEAGGDMEAAVDFLRKSGIAKAEKKSGRATNNGKVLAAVEAGKGALVEVLIETDFAANTDRFVDFVNSVAKDTLKLNADGDVTEAINEQEKTELTDKIAIIGENMQIRRAVKWDTKGQISTYIHQGGRVSVMLDSEGETDENFLRMVCMHIAAFRPAYAIPSDIPVATVEHEKEIAKAQLVGKPENMIEKIVDGKINKWFGEVCLTRQPWIEDDKTSLAQLKPNLKINRFIRWEVGEEL